jgi:hypothetical protein
MAEFKPESAVLFPSDPTAEYREIPKTERNNLSAGQRKLLLTEIYFLNHYWNSTEIPFPTIVYAGAAPGQHFPILSSLFPEITFELYDPSDFKIPPGENTKGKIRMHNEIFTDLIAQQYVGRNDIFFISDIRCTTYSTDAARCNPEQSLDMDNEELVVEDMRAQERWYNIIKPVRALLKMRLPYAYNFVPKYFRYLGGQIIKQPWAPQMSTETRLVPIYGKESDYDVEKYGNQMFYYNTEIRQKTKYKNVLNDTVGPIDDQELLDDFDSNYEAFILREYLEKRNLIDKNVVDNVRKLSRYISLRLSDLHKKDVRLSYLRTIS